METWDPRVDSLQRELERTIQFSVKLEYDRSTIFEYAWHLLQQAKGSDDEVLPTLPALAAPSHYPVSNRALVLLSGTHHGPVGPILKMARRQILHDAPHAL